MILRNVAVRQGRAVISAPLRTATASGARTISTEPPSTSSLSHASSPPTQPPPTVNNTQATSTTSPAGTPLATVPRVLDPKLQARFGQVKVVAAPDLTAKNWQEAQRDRRNSAWLGSAQSDRRYLPGDLLKDPPTPGDVTLELLMASQCHMGHHTSLWNPANSRYIYGIRQGIHIISLEQTAAHLRRAARLVEEVAYCGGLILFVGTRKGQIEIVTRAAGLAKACHLFNKWTPGTITNRDQLLGRGGLKMVDEQDRELPGFATHLEQCRPITPDLVVCLNPMENFILLHECMLGNIPTIGVIDTNADATKVTYPIPANDDSLRSIAVIAGVLGRAGEAGQKRRLEDAKEGKVHWENPADVAKALSEMNFDAEAAAVRLAEQEMQAEASMHEAETVKSAVI